jgi:carboxymethylenebutenolidase
MAQSTETVSFSSSSGNAEGVIARPGAGKPGVIVVQEWWGIVPHIKDVASRFAQLGFVALAPDLYHGKSTLDAAEAQHLMQGLDWGRAAAELGGAIRHLREVEGCTTVGVVGFCMGGALSMIAATMPGVNAYAAFYGFPPRGAAPVEKITAPGLIFFGEHESHFSIPDARAFAEAQRAKGVATELVVYPGAQHAFFNDTRTEVFQPAAANDAWRRTGPVRGAPARLMVR